MTRARAIAVLPLGAATIGVAFVLAGSHVRARANSRLLEETIRSVSHSWALNNVAEQAASGERGRAASLAAVNDAIAQAADPVEVDALLRAQACLETASCQADIAHILEPAREAYTRRLGQRWTATALRSHAGNALLALGAALCLGGSALGTFLLGRAHQGPGERERREEPPAAGAAPPTEIEQMLRRRLEDLYAVRQRAWQSDRFAAYGEVAAGLSHGLKTPLASIRAAAQVARVKCGPEHPALPHIDDVIQEADALVTQVRHFLQAAGSGAPVPVPIEVQHLVGALDHDYAPAASARGLGWQARIEGSPGRVSVDPALLEMALRNLVENALAAAPSGSTVAVIARPSEAPARAGLDHAPPPAGGWVEIGVCDRGAGIPSKVVRGEVTGEAQGDGRSGLGLAIARRIVARHGGAIGFEVDEGKGTTVRVLLPVVGQT